MGMTFWMVQEDGGERSERESLPTLISPTASGISSGATRACETPKLAWRKEPAPMPRRTV